MDDDGINNLELICFAWIQVANLQNYTYRPLWQKNKLWYSSLRQPVTNSAWERVPSLSRSIFEKISCARAEEISWDLKAAKSIYHINYLLFRYIMGTGPSDIWHTWFYMINVTIHTTTHLRHPFHLIDGFNYLNHFPQVKSA